MGIRKISGIVLKKNRRYIKILRDDRHDGGYDLLTYSGAARYLAEGDRFSLFVTAISMKKSKGIKICTFTDSTFQKDRSKSFQISFNEKELKLLLYIANEKYEFIINNPKHDNYTNEDIKHLNSILNKIASEIYSQ
ncbi:hypothetical protein [Porcipelethomonas sp.]|uniref:hypothetical protein n=1 Tax=Porcipelethomonas sp. TaxID=2981675 RepID=UPI003EF3734B